MKTRKKKRSKFSKRIRKKYKALVNNLDQRIKNYADSLEVDYKKRAELNDNIKQIFLFLVLALFGFITLGLVQEGVITLKLIEHVYGWITKITLSQWSDFSSNLFATLIGASVGIPIALIIDRIIQRRKGNDTKLILLYSLLDTLSLNLGILSDLEQNIKKSKLNLYHFDIESLNYTNLLRYELISDLELIRRLEKVRYHSNRLQRILDLMIELPMSSMGANRIEVAKELMDKFIEMILLVAQPLKKEITIATTSIINEINVTENYPFYILARGFFSVLGVDSKK